MAFFESIWWLLVLIGVMIVVHELGHYWAARYFDVKVEAFSFGFGPRLFGWRRGETDWRVSAIPFGGYVKMYGEQPGEINSDPNATSDPRAFQSKPRWQRVIIAFAGPFMNILLAVVFVAGLYMFHFERDRAFEEPAKIGYVAPDSPAGKLGIAAGDQIVRIDDISYPNWEQVFLRTVAAPDREIPIVVDRNGEKRALTIIPRQDKRTSAGIAGWSPLSDVVIRRLETDLDAYRQGARPGDKVKKINGVVVTAPERVSELTRASNGGPVTLLLERNGKEFEITAKPEMRKTEDAPQGRAIIGLLPGPDIKVVQLPFGEAVAESVKQNAKFAGSIYYMLRGMLEAKFSPKQLEGPVRMAQMSREAAKGGPEVFIGFMAMVSMNLAVFNLLPIPILDGGVILLLLIEMLVRRDLSLQIKETIFKVGFVFLMTLVVFVLYNDITKVIRS